MADEKWADYFIEVTSSNIPKESVNIRGVGRGNMNITQDISSLRLPKAAMTRQKDDKSTSGGPSGIGRGGFCSFMTDRPARLPKDHDKNRGLIGIHNTNSFPSLQSALATSKQSPSNSPKTSTKHTKSVSHQSSSALSSTDSDLNWPSLSSLSESQLKKSTDHQSFALACKETGNTNNSMQSLPKDNTPSDSSEIIIMRNLPEAILEEDLRELLQLYGNVITCDIERDNQGNSLGCALISMEAKAECEWIISCFHDQEYPGCTGFSKLSCTFLC